MLASLVAATTVGDSYGVNLATDIKLSISAAAV